MYYAVRTTERPISKQPIGLSIGNGRYVTRTSDGLMVRDELGFSFIIPVVAAIAAGAYGVFAANRHKQEMGKVRDEMMYQVVNRAKTPPYPKVVAIASKVTEADTVVIAKAAQAQGLNTISAGNPIGKPAIAFAPSGKFIVWASSATEIPGAFSDGKKTDWQSAMAVLEAAKLANASYGSFFTEAVYQQWYSELVQFYRAVEEDKTEIVASLGTSNRPSVFNVTDVAVTVLGVATVGVLGYIVLKRKLWQMVLPRSGSTPKLSAN
jgi:hypothetical protein